MRPPLRHGPNYLLRFGLAALGMLLSWALIQFDGGRLDGYGETPAGQEKDRGLVVYLGAILGHTEFDGFLTTLEA